MTEKTNFDRRQNEAKPSFVQKSGNFVQMGGGPMLSDKKTTSPNQKTRFNLKQFAFLGVTAFICLSTFIVCIVALGRGPSLRADSFSDGTYTWTYKTLDNVNEIQIEKVSPAPTGAFSVPNKINGKTVKIVGSGDEGLFGQKSTAANTSVTSLTIPNTVVNINLYAFSYCTALTTVTFTPTSTVGTINQYAFIGCTALNNITLPDSVITLGSYSFQDCKALPTINIPAYLTVINTSVFYGCSLLNNIVLPNSLASIGSGAFQNCAALTSINIPESITIINANTFYGCTNLSTINSATPGTFNLPSAVTSIGESAFRTCKALQSIIVPDGITILNRYTFSGCSALTDVTIPTSVKSFQENVFASCTSLETIVLPDSITSISSTGYTFNGCTNLKNVTLPSNLTIIAQYTFQNCTSLVNLTLPSAIYALNSNSFNGCTNLSTINSTVPGTYDISNITTLGTYVFRGCTALTDIVLPDGRPGIPAYTFYGCTSLANITIPSSVTLVGECAFYNCKSLVTITLPSSVQTIGSYAFYGCIALEDFTVPPLVTVIESQTFYGCTALATINISGVRQINTEAFRNCTTLTDIIIPGGIIHIGPNVFTGCSALTITVDLFQAEFDDEVDCGTNWHGGRTVIFNTASLTELIELIAYAETLDENDYTPSSWAEADLAAAIANAQVVVDKGTAAEPEEVDYEYNELLKAINKLVEITDKTTLEGLIAEAEALADEEKQQEIKANPLLVIAYNRLLDSLETAREIYEEENVTQAQVNFMCDLLNMDLAQFRVGGKTPTEDDDGSFWKNLMKSQWFYVAVVAFVTIVGCICATVWGLHKDEDDQERKRKKEQKNINAP